ncbi:MAG TPA: asparagine synthase C-terminal domain-containing protein, partial [Gemmatimonadaceae bacterium]
RGVLVFSNSLDVVRAFPGVSSELDEGAVGDMLRIGYNSDPATTVFAVVRCVPAAHTMVVSGGDTTMRRYWDLPTGSDVRFRHVEDYADRFAELLELAVSDCVRGLDDAAILFSGGRDSTAVAAMARSVLDRTGAPRLHAVTAVFDYAIPDQERTYASMAATGLGIPVDFLPQDEYGWYESWDRADLWRPEPPESPGLAADAAIQARAAAHARIALTGEGGDAALRETESHLARLLQSGHWWRALTETAQYVRWHRRMPRPGFRRQRQRRAGLTSPYSPVPPWMRPKFIARAKLNERWSALEAHDGRAWRQHAIRPEAYSKLSTPFWARCFEEEHSTATGHHLTLRHPFFDERVVEFLLGLPATQWLNDKGIVVASMRHRLPRRVVFRNKTPLAGDSYDVAFRASGAVRPDRSAFDGTALRFIDPDLLFSGDADMAEFDQWNWVRAYSLALWLRRLPTGRAFVAPMHPVQLDVDGSV